MSPPKSVNEYPGERGSPGTPKADCRANLSPTFHSCCQFSLYWQSRRQIHAPKLRGFYPNHPAQAYVCCPRWPLYTRTCTGCPYRSLPESRRRSCPASQKFPRANRLRRTFLNRLLLQMSPCIFFICELFHIYSTFCSLFFKCQRLFTKTFAFFTQNILPCFLSYIRFCFSICF